MAHPQSASFRQSQGDRRLAPPQVTAFTIAVFLAGIGWVGGGLAIGTIAVFGFLAAGALFAWKRQIVAALFLPLACIAGVFYYHFYFAVRAAGVSVPFNSSIRFSGIVADEPGHSAKSEYFSLRLLVPSRGTIEVFAAPGSGFKYGDSLQLQGTINSPEKERDLPAAVFPKIMRVGTRQGSPLRQALLDIKYRLLDPLPRYLSAEEAAFLGGLTLGEKADFSPAFIQSLAASGTTHLVALSGYNIAILVFVVFGGFLLFLPRRAAFCLTITAIFLFVLMVGLQPSVVRAAIMGSIILLSREIGRPYSLLYAFGWTAFIMVLCDPASLFSPGFQLSFMSLLGIVYLSPVILRWLGTSGEEGPVPLAGFRENAALTIAAQMAVAPIALNYFGAVSLTSFIANAIILPFIPMTMLSGFVLIACGSIFAPLGILVAWISHILLAYEIGVIGFFAVFRLPVTGSLSWLWVIFYYLALAALAWRYGHEEE